MHYQQITKTIEEEIINGGVYKAEILQSDYLPGQIEDMTILVNIIHGKNPEL